MEAPVLAACKRPAFAGWFHRLGVARAQNVAAGAGIAALIWFVYFTINPITESIDYVLFYKPNFQFLINSLKDGELPLWNPYVGLGRPFLADLQNAVFYPPVYLMFLGEKPGLFLLIWVHYSLGFFGMRALAREFGAGKPQSWLAGLVFLLAAPMTTRLFVGQLLYVCGLCYLPLLFLCAMRLEQGGARILAAYAAVLALQLLTGHPQVFWLSLIGQGVFIAARSTYGRNHALRTGGKYLLCVAWALLLCAIAVLPFSELVQHGNRASDADELSAFGRLGWRHLFGFFTLPPISGSAGWEEQLFIGCLFFLPGLAGLTKIREPNIRGLLAIFLVALLLASDVVETVTHFSRECLPGYASFRLHCRTGFLMVMALCGSASLWFTDDAFRSERQRIPLAMGMVVAAAALACFPVQKVSGLILGRTLPVMQVVGVMIGLWLFARRRTGPTRKWLFVGLVVASATELLTYSVVHRKHFTFQKVMGISPEFLKREELVTELTTRFASWKSRQPPRVMLPSQVVPLNDGMIYGFSQCDAYTSLFLWRPWAFLHAVHGVKPPSALNTSLSLDVYETSMPSIFGFDVQARWDARKQWIVFEPTNAMSVRAHVVFAAQKVTTAESLRRMTSGFDVSRSALVERDVQLTARSAIPARSAAITSFRRNEVFVEAEAIDRGMLVVSEAWYPGWKAKMDGLTFDMQPVNFWMRGIALPPGKHVIRLFYRQNYLVIGAVISAAAALGLLVVSWPSPVVSVIRVAKSRCWNRACLLALGRNGHLNRGEIVLDYERRP
jgi:hypothetical protein